MTPSNGFAKALLYLTGLTIPLLTKGFVFYYSYSNVGNLLKRFVQSTKVTRHSRTISVLVILIIAAAVPLTVLVAQQQQKTEQHAAIIVPCNPSKNTCSPGSTGSCRCGGFIQCTRVNISRGACYMWTGSCRACPTARPACTGGSTCTSTSYCRANGTISGGSGCNGANTVCCKFKK